jgi:Ca-activated chloride channel family protein
MGDFPQLASPGWLLVLGLLPLLALRHHRRPRVPALTYSRLPHQRRYAGGSVGGSVGLWRLHLPFYCRLLALALLIVALGRPQWGESWEESTSEGIDIEVVLDVSGSMGAEDFQPKNRLAVARDVVVDFVRRRPTDRLGLVIFAGSAVTRAPLTTDRRTLINKVHEVELGQLPDGTAIGVALATAALRLRHSAATSKVVVLITDGANNAGEIDPQSAAALCAGLGIRVYTIGVGTDERVPVPRHYTNPRTGRPAVERRYLQLEVDEELLTAIAERTRGQFYLATDAEALRRIFIEIDRLEKTEITVERRVSYRDMFQPFAATALGLLLLPTVGAALRWTVEP